MNQKPVLVAAIISSCIFIWLSFTAATANDLLAVAAKWVSAVTAGTAFLSVLLRDQLIRPLRLIFKLLLVLLFCAQMVLAGVIAYRIYTDYRAGHETSDALKGVYN